MGTKQFIKEVISGQIYRGKKLFRLTPGRVNAYRILMYHAVEDRTAGEDTTHLSVPPSVFRMQMEYLKTHGFRVIDLLELSSNLSNKLPIPDKTIAVTFDDGFKSVMTNAVPVLKEFGFPATLFVNSYFIEKKLPRNFYWREWDTLSWEDVKEVYSSGLAVGSHGVSHRRLTDLEENEVDKELRESRLCIERNIGSEIRTFCYPHGAFDEKVKRAVKNNGFDCACTGLEGTNGINADLLQLKRTEITAACNTPLMLEKKIIGCYDWMGYLGVHR